MAGGEEGFTVVDMDRHRIDKVRVVLEQKPEVEGSEKDR